MAKRKQTSNKYSVSTKMAMALAASLSVAPVVAVTAEAASPFHPIEKIVGLPNNTFTYNLYSLFGEESYGYKIPSVSESSVAQVELSGAMLQIRLLKAGQTTVTLEARNSTLGKLSQTFQINVLKVDTRGAAAFGDIASNARTVKTAEEASSLLRRVDTHTFPVNHAPNVLTNKYQVDFDITASLPLTNFFTDIDPGDSLSYQVAANGDYGNVHAHIENGKVVFDRLDVQIEGAISPLGVPDHLSDMDFTLAATDKHGATSTAVVTLHPYSGPMSKGAVHVVPNGDGSVHQTVDLDSVFTGTGPLHYKVLGSESVTSNTYTTNNGVTAAVYGDNHLLLNGMLSSGATYFDIDATDGKGNHTETISINSASAPQMYPIDYGYINYLDGSAIDFTADLNDYVSDPDYGDSFTFALSSDSTWDGVTASLVAGSMLTVTGHPTDGNTSIVIDVTDKYGQTGRLHFYTYPNRAPTAVNPIIQNFFVSQSDELASRDVYLDFNDPEWSISSWSIDYNKSIIPYGYEARVGTDGILVVNKIDSNDTISPTILPDSFNVVVMTRDYLGAAAQINYVYHKFSQPLNLDVTNETNNTGIDLDLQNYFSFADNWNVTLGGLPKGADWITQPDPVNYPAIVHINPDSASLPATITVQAVNQTDSSMVETKRITLTPKKLSIAPPNRQVPVSTLSMLILHDLYKRYGLTGSNFTFQAMTDGSKTVGQYEAVQGSDLMIMTYDGSGPSVVDLVGMDTSGQNGFIDQLSFDVHTLIGSSGFMSSGDMSSPSFFIAENPFNNSKYETLNATKVDSTSTTGVLSLTSDGHLKIEFNGSLSTFTVHAYNNDDHKLSADYIIPLPGL